MALDFDGVSGYLDVGSVLNPTADMTVSAWIRRDSVGGADEVISKEPATAQGYTLQILATNFAQFGVFNGGYPVSTSTTSIAAGTVYHLCGVRDSGAALLRIYVNGVQEDTTASGAAPSASGVNLNIGRQPVAARYFDGAIEDVRVYDRALSADEVMALYLARGRDRIHNGLVGRWLCTERPPGTTLNNGGGSFDILNHQTNTVFGGTFNQIQLSYTIPSGLSNPVLIVLGGAEHGTFANAQPSACLWGSTSMTKRAGTNTTVTYGAGSAIFALGVTAGTTETITMSFPGNIGDGNTGGVLHAITVEGALFSTNVTTTGFNNAGNTSLSFTTTGGSKVGLSHHFTGDSSATTGATGTGHTLIGEVVSGGSLFTSRIGYFNALTAGAYSGYSYGFSGTPNRSAMSMAAFDLVATSADIVPDQTNSGFNAAAGGSITSVENIGLV